MPKPPIQIDDTLFAETIRTLLAVVEGTDMYLPGHYKRMAALCNKFSKSIGLSQDKVNAIHLACLLHDIGMVYVPSEIIHKNDSLDQDELRVVSQHPVMSEKILSHYSPLEVALPIIRHHHEAVNGSGYPDGLSGQNIPLGSRILSLVESYFVMVLPRPYRAAMNKDRAIQEIRNLKGVRYDHGLVDAFIDQLDPKTTAPASPAVKPKKEASDTNVTATIVELFKRGEVKLPLLPKIINDINAALSNPDSSTDDLVAIIEKDSSVSIRLVSAANSPLYRGHQKVRNLREAIPRIGLQETQSIVSTIISKNMYQSKNKARLALMEKLWQHSLATGYAGRAIAEMLGYPDIEKYFLMGLVHDIGKALILRVISETPSMRDTIAPAEIEQIFIKAHNSIGGIILRHWKFPKQFFEVATSHEGPKFFKTTGKATLIINAANLLTRTIGFSLFEEDVDFSKLDSIALLKIEPEKLPPLGAKVKQLMEESKVAF